LIFELRFITDSNVPNEVPNEGEVSDEDEEPEDEMFDVDLYSFNQDGIDWSSWISAST
jgi:hypothetical protein